MTPDTPRPLPSALVEITCGHCKTPLTVLDSHEHVCERCVLNYGDDPFDDAPAKLWGNVAPCAWTPGMPTGRSGTIVVQHPCDLGAGHFGDHRYTEETFEKSGAGWCARVSAS